MYPTGGKGNFPFPFPLIPTLLENSQKSFEYFHQNTTSGHTFWYLQSINDKEDYDFYTQEKKLTDSVSSQELEIAIW